MQDLLPTAIYVRVSSEMQAGEDRYSIPEQIDRLRKYCDAQGWTIAKEYVDPGHSGRSCQGFFATWFAGPGMSEVSQQWQ